MVGLAPQSMAVDVIAAKINQLISLSRKRFCKRSNVKHPKPVLAKVRQRTRTIQNKTHPKEIAQLAHGIDRKPAYLAYKPQLDCHSLVKLSKQY